jgi:outer membrane protein TolC
VLRIESELDRIGEELQTGRHQVVPAAAELNRALGRSSWAPLPEFGLPTVETLSLEREDLLREALQHNPRLRASDYQLAAGEQGVQLAGREKYPGFRAGVEWMENPGRRDEVRATVGISLPIWRERYAAAEREARAVREGVRHERAALGQELESRLAMAIFRLRNAERKERLYRESLVPRARATVEAVEGAYRGGRANFLELVDSQRTLIALELAQAEVLAEQFQRWAELEELAGADAMANGPGRADERPTD